jgi:putative PIN family toxin of toxin-antitoxin system
MRINRFVLDNNIWVSYFITKSEDRLLQIIEKNALTVYSCDELVQELRTVLNYPHLEKFSVNLFIASREPFQTSSHPPPAISALPPPAV